MTKKPENKRKTILFTITHNHTHREGKNKMSGNKYKHGRKIYNQNFKALRKTKQGEH